MANQLSPVMRPLCAMALIAPFIFAPATAQAKEINLTSKFRISYLGLNVGVMKSYTKIAGDRYTISGGARSNSVVSIFTNAKAHFSSSGEICSLLFRAPGRPPPAGANGERDNVLETENEDLASWRGARPQGLDSGCSRQKCSEEIRT